MGGEVGGGTGREPSSPGYSVPAQAHLSQSQMLSRSLLLLWKWSMNRRTGLTWFRKQSLYRLEFLGQCFAIPDDQQHNE